jgi:ABC-type transport system involved in multi-copper enzyme maturation permease subunit
LLSYGAISGDKEEGLLSLTLSNSVPRSKILLSKYLGALVSVAVPLAFCFILGILFILVSKNVEVDASFFASMGLFYCVSLLYLSCILLLGILASTMTKTSFASLLFLLTFYLVFNFLIPQAVKNYSNDAIAARTRNVESNIANLQTERGKKSGEAYRNAGFIKTWVISRDAYDMQLYGGIILSRISSPEWIEDENRTFSYMKEIERDYAQKVYDLKAQDMAVEKNIRGRQNSLLAFVPSSNFGRIAEFVMDTGNESLERYLQQVNLYWHQYMSYLDQKNAFGKRFAYPGPDELATYEKELIKKISEDVSGLIPNEYETWISHYSGKYLDEALKYRPKLTFLDLNDLPAFKAPEPAFIDRLKGSLFNIGILLFYNVLFIAVAYFSFANYDPRRRD